MRSENQNKEKKAMIVGLFLIIIVGLITCSRLYLKNKDENNQASKNGTEISNYPGISPKDLQQKIKNKENLAIVDIRSNDDFQTEHIIDSINIPFNQLEKTNVEAGQEKLIVVLSDDNSQYSEAVKIIKNKDFTNVLALSGGLVSWKNNNGQTISWGDPALLASRSKVTFISPEDVKKNLDAKIPMYILDVRIDTAFTEHLPGAINIPLYLLEKRRSEIPLGTQVIAYGNTDMEGFEAGVRLYDLNILSVQVLTGGFSGWKNKGYPTVSK